MSKMKASEFISKLKTVATDYKTLYVMGCFGAPMTAANKKRYTQNHSYNRQAARTRMINAASEDTFGFDCVCLIKGVLWGWSGNTGKTYGGAIYKANGVPDIGADQMITVCSGVTSDFSSIVPGEAVWCKGHIGVYIGDGLAVECTPAWKNKVQITAVSNIGAKSGYNARKWTKHGKLPYIDYDTAGATTMPSTSTSSYKTGSTNEETCYNFLTSVVGLNCAAACGVLANIRAESGFNPNALGDSGTSYGICQWHNTRWTNLKNWCAQNGKDDTTLDGQLWYLKYELEKSYSGVLKTIKAVLNTAQGAYDAAYCWCVKFEIPANKETVGMTRGNYAKSTYFPKYSGTSSTTTTTVTKPSTKVDYAQKFDKSIAGTYKVTAKSGLHIRAGASTSKSSLGVLPYGTTVSNYGYYSVAGDGTKWLYVKTADGIVGFCSSIYLSM